MTKSTIDILIYHDVCKTAEDVKFCSNEVYTTPLPKLICHLEWLAKAGYRAIRLNEWVGARKSNIVWKGKYVILTFDGPHAGWFKNVVPLLSKKKIPAVFFVTAGWVGKNHAYPESRSITWNDLSELGKFKDRNGLQLFEIGSHSMWHTVLERSENENEKKFQNRMNEEIVESAKRLHENTGLIVNSFAPPKGRGKLKDLADFLNEAGINSIRWASLPGRSNNFNQDLFDLQISYCDMNSFTENDFKSAFSNKFFKLFLKLKKMQRNYKL
jgi:peptidoglycan/xylan/chitin deacetylase (PgdA/CDA1 family)